MAPGRAWQKGHRLQCPVTGLAGINSGAAGATVDLAACPCDSRVSVFSSTSSAAHSS